MHGILRETEREKCQSGREKLSRERKMYEVRLDRATMLSEVAVLPF
jgi:hypothetical protein